MTGHQTQKSKVRYGVIAGGWISQAGFMPGARGVENSQLVALVTGDPHKAKSLAAKYGISAYSYEDYDRLLSSGEIDAVYLALPNHLHCAYAERALSAGIHVLLEKPMANSEDECRRIIAAAQKSNAKLMIAYRLHFEPATLEVMRLVREGKIGEPRAFSSIFTQCVAASNHRAQNGFWAGPVADMGPYPINAARNLFGSEPIEVCATGVRGPSGNFDFHDTVSVVLRFPNERVAQFTVSYNVNAVDEYRIIGTQGDIHVSPGYMFGVPLQFEITLGSEKTRRLFPNTNQFGAEMKYFSDCVLQDTQPEPDGAEGLADVRVVAAIERSLSTGAPIALEPINAGALPDPAQSIVLPAPTTLDLINASPPDVC